MYVGMLDTVVLLQPTEAVLHLRGCDSEQVAENKQINGWSTHTHTGTTENGEGRAPVAS